jgi:hypothetical protein
VKGLNREVMLSPIKLTAFVASEATTGTIIRTNIIATIKMTIRHARFMFIMPPLPNWDQCSFARIQNSSFFSVEQP